MSHFECRWSQGKLYPSARSLAAAKYQARRQGSAMGLCVAHLDEGSVNCPLRTSRGHILDSICWTMKITSLPRSLTGRDYFPLQCSVFSFPLAGRGFVFGASSLSSRHLLKGNGPLTGPRCTGPDLTRSSSECEREPPQVIFLIS